MVTVSHDALIGSTSTFQHLLQVFEHVFGFLAIPRVEVSARHLLEMPPT